MSCKNIYDVDHAQDILSILLQNLFSLPLPEGTADCTVFHRSSFPFQTFIASMALLVGSHTSDKTDTLWWITLKIFFQFFCKICFLCHYQKAPGTALSFIVHPFLSGHLLPAWLCWLVAMHQTRQIHCGGRSAGVTASSV